MEVNNLHIENLSKLCRVCGCRLTKQKIHQTSYSCEEFLAKNFQIQIEKDDKSIHPVRFCHLCFCTKTREHFTWKAHNDDHCPTCETEQRHKKGGRRKKSRRGGGKREGKRYASSSWPRLLTGSLNSMKSLRLWRGRRRNSSAPFAKTYSICLSRLLAVTARAVTVSLVQFRTVFSNHHALYASPILQTPRTSPVHPGHSQH